MKKVDEQSFLVEDSYIFSSANLGFQNILIPNGTSFFIRTSHQNLLLFLYHVISVELSFCTFLSNVYKCQLIVCFYIDTIFHLEFLEFVN